MTDTPDADPADDAALTETFQEIMTREGYVSNLLQLLAHAPDALRPFAELDRYCRYGTQLTPRQRALAILVAVRDVHYGWMHQAPLALLAGLSEEQLLLIREGRTPRDLDAAERAICDYAFEIAACRRIPPRVHDALLATLETRQIVDAALLTAYFMSAAALILALDVELESPETLQHELDWQRAIAGTPPEP